MRLAYRQFLRQFSCFVVFFAVWLAANEVATQDKSFLWRVTSDRNTVYILGSIHVLRKDNYPLGKIIEEAFTKSETLVFEIDFRSMDSEKVQALIRERGFYRDGKLLPLTISSDTYDLAKERASKLGMDLRALSSVKPWLLAVMLTQLNLQKLGFEAKYGVDRHYFERAQAEQKRITGLETIENQIAVFDLMPEQQQELLLRQTLQDLQTLDHGVERLVRAWSTGDRATVEDLMLSSFRDQAELYKRIVLDRNRRWLRELEKFLRERTVHMVVVGCAHLVGKGNIIELLRERGYTVEQM